MTTSLEEWAKARHLSLTLVFTDVVSSTLLGQSLGDDIWINDLADHFRSGREIAADFDHHVVKVIGDAFMIAFRNSVEAVEFALRFSKNTGRPHIGIRVGVHIGRIRIMDDDIYGLNVNKAARIQSHGAAEGILLSQPIMEDYVKAKGVASRNLFQEIDTDLKSFGQTKLWRVEEQELKAGYLAARRARLLIWKQTARATIINR
jgi:class 3 adenylate cyclase